MNPTTAASRSPLPPSTREGLRQRWLLYPPALLLGALALLVDQPRWQAGLLTGFVLLMLTPLALKAAAASEGRLGAAVRWLTRRRLSATTEGSIFLVLTILFGVAAINTGTNLLYLLLSLLLTLIVASGVLSELDVKGLRLMRRLPAAVFAREPAELEIVVHNPRRLVPAWVIEIGELEGPFGPEGEWTPGPRRMLAHLPPGEKAVLTVRHRFARRGAFALSGFELRTRFPFGFFTKYARASLPAELLVLPAIRPLAAHVWLERLPATGDRQRAGRRQRGGDEFRSLRDYRRGDPPRWIHWRSSARTGALQVREFEPLRTERAVVVVDADPGPLPRRAPDPTTPSEADRALDRVADLAASLLAGLGRREVPRRLVIAASTGLLEPPVGPTATPQLGALEALARLAPGDDPHGELLRSALERVRGPAALYVVTAREPGLVERLLGRHGSSAAPVRVLSVRTEADAARHYAESSPGTEPLATPCDTPRPELATP